MMRNTLLETKRAKLLLGACALALGLALSGQAQTPFTNGLIAYYPFNGNANDASGNGLNGINNGAALTTDRFGRPSSAYSFNGSNSRIDFSQPPLTSVTNWTITAWVKPADFTQERIAVQVGYDDAHTGNGYGFGFAGTAQWIGIHSGVGAGWIYSGQSLTSTNDWYHVVMLRDGTTTKFFINGLQTPNTDSTAFTAPTDFTIGSQNGVRFFKGLIDDVRIYNRVLSESEVAQLYSFEAGYLNIHKAVYLDTCGLAIGSTYQLQISSDLSNWTNQGAPFTATDSNWRSTNYWDVEDWNRLFFRLVPQ